MSAKVTECARAARRMCMMMTSAQAAGLHPMHTQLDHALRFIGIG